MARVGSPGQVAAPLLPAVDRPGRGRLDDRALAYLMDAYRAGDTAASIGAAHGLSVRSVKPTGRLGSAPQATAGLTAPG
jgi:hypothetical protein